MSPALQEITARIEKRIGPIPKPTGPNKYLEREIELANEARLKCMALKSHVPEFYRAAWPEAGLPFEVYSILSSGGSIYVCGDSGAGKTWAVCAAINRLMAETCDSRFATAAEVVEAFLSNKQDKAFDELVSSRFLAVDDIDKLSFEAQPWKAEALFSLADKRQGKPTAWTSNLDYVGMLDRLSGMRPDWSVPLMRRISDQCGCERRAAGRWSPQD